MITLKRPESRNALGKQLIAELCAALDTIRQEATTRAVVFRSDCPGVFCAGADLKERANMSQQEASEFVNKLRSTFTSIQQLPMATIALVEGAALGGGAELALACDFRYCGLDATFAWPETRLGIIPGAGGTQRLPRLVGPTRAKDLIFTGRHVSSTEAQQLGLACHVSSEGRAMADALKFAAQLAGAAPLAMRAAKAAIDDGASTDLHTGLRLEQHCYGMILNSRDRMEGLLAFKEKRKPAFTGT